MATCPQCGHQFDAEQAMAAELTKKLEHEAQQKLQAQLNKVNDEAKKLDEEKNIFEEKKKLENVLFQKKLEQEKQKIEKEVQAQLAQSIAADFENRLTLLQNEKDDNAIKLKQARQKEIEYYKKEQALQNKEAELEITLQKKLQEERFSLIEQIRKQEIEKNMHKENEKDMRMRELEKQLEIQKKLAEEMKRKAEQGSMQLQGEVQEQALEEMLRISFPFDSIVEVGKGVRGADCIQTVRNTVGQDCGKIIYESKRTEAFSAEWIDKLKKDKVAQNADIAVIVTKTMPKDLAQFGEKNGVYICNYTEAKSLAVVLRNAVLKISESRNNQQNKGSKMSAMYDYLTSQEFVGTMQAMQEGFRDLRNMMQKEREDFEKNFKKKEKQIELIILNSSRISGSVEGIAGHDLIKMQLVDE